MALRPQTRKQPLLQGIIQTTTMDRHADLVAPCGMNCGTCSIFLAGTRDMKKLGVRMPCCRGCRPRDKSCAFLKKQCRLLTEGTMMFCSMCPGFPCERLVGLDKRYRERSHISMLENLACIKDRGLDAFLHQESEKWKCPRCGGTFPCHNGICFDCGSERLRERAMTKSGLYCWAEQLK